MKDDDREYNQELYEEKVNEGIVKHNKMGVLFMVVGGISLSISLILRFVYKEYNFIFTLIGIYYSISGIFYILTSKSVAKHSNKHLIVTENEIVNSIRKSRIKGIVIMIITCVLSIFIVPMSMLDFSYDSQTIIIYGVLLLGIVGTSLLNVSRTGNKIEEHTPEIDEELEKSKQLCNIIKNPLLFLWISIMATSLVMVFISSNLYELSNDIRGVGLLYLIMWMIIVIKERET